MINTYQAICIYLALFFVPTFSLRYFKVMKPTNEEYVCDKEETAHVVNKKLAFTVEEKVFLKFSHYRQIRHASTPVGKYLQAIGGQ